VDRARPLVAVLEDPGVILVIIPGLQWLFPFFAVLAMVFGVLLILPIGGADMPTVISLLNKHLEVDNRRQVA
jgi:NAD/NADP transhydrogenase beta subunit